MRKLAKNPGSEIRNIVELLETERNSPVARDYSLHWSDSEIDLLDNMMAQKFVAKRKDFRIKRAGYKKMSE